MCRLKNRLLDSVVVLRLLVNTLVQITRGSQRPIFHLRPSLPELGAYSRVSLVTICHLR